MSPQYTPDEIRAILQRVIDGELTSDQASAILSGRDDDTSDTSDGSGSDTGAEGAAWADGPGGGTDDDGPVDWESVTDPVGHAAGGESGDRNSAGSTGAAGGAGAAGGTGGAGGTQQDPLRDLADGAQDAVRSMMDWMRGTAEQMGQTGVPRATRRTSAPRAADPGPAAGSANLPARSELHKVTVRATGRRVRIIGEPSVKGIAIDGSHQVQRSGNQITVVGEGELGMSIDGFSVIRTRTLDDVKSQLAGIAKELQIRVNPRLEVEVEVTGGSIHVERAPGLRRVRLTGGNVHVKDAGGPLDIVVQAGFATVDSRIVSGNSRIRVESGGATIKLAPDSDVHVHSDASLGRISWSGTVSGSSTDVTLGDGSARLDVEALLGNVSIQS